MKYIIEEELYDKIRTLLCNYEDLLSRIGGEYRNGLLEDDWNAFYGLVDKYDSLPTYESESTAGERREPTVGDHIRVIDSGESYTIYCGWIERYISEPAGRYLWDYGKACNDGDEGIVLFVAPHGCGNENLAYVKMDNERCYLIGVKGLEII